MDQMEIDQQAHQEEFKIAMNKKIFEKLVEDAQPEYIRNKQNEVKEKSKKLSGTWVEPFIKPVNEFEKNDFKILGMILIFWFIFYQLLRLDIILKAKLVEFMMKRRKIHPFIFEPLPNVMTAKTANVTTLSLSTISLLQIVKVSWRLMLRKLINTITKQKKNNKSVVKIDANWLKSFYLPLMVLQLHLLME
jgi:hypothetical protein